MKFNYVMDRAQVPQIALGGGVLRPRPIIPFHIAVPGSGAAVLDGHLDTAADDTIFPAQTAANLGLDLTGAPAQVLHLAGRPQPFPVQYQPVLLRITDGVHEIYEWTATVGFVPIPLKRPLLGYAGFLQFFNAEFRGADQEVILVPNASFPGTQFRITPP
jgi:hypothetical protein